MMQENMTLQNLETNVLRLKRELEAVQKEQQKKLEDLAKVTRRKEMLEIEMGAENPPHEQKYVKSPGSFKKFLGF